MILNAPSIPEDLRQNIGYLLGLAFRRYRTVLAEFLYELGLYPGQEAVMLALWERDGRTMRELAMLAGVTLPTITKMIQRLEKAGLVERMPGYFDRRIQAVYLMKLGKHLQKPVLAAMRELEELALRKIPSTDTVKLKNLLHKLALGLDLPESLRGPR